MKTIIEVGAHTGDETLKFLQDIEARVFAFEPDKKKFADLYRLSKAYSRLTVLPFAVDAGDGQETLFHAEDGGSSLSSRLHVPGIQHAMVWTIRLDTFFSLYHIDHVDYLRIDTPWNEALCVESLGDDHEKVERGRVRCYGDRGEVLTWLYDRGFSVGLDTISNDVEHPDIRFWRN